MSSQPPVETFMSQEGSEADLCSAVIIFLPFHLFRQPIPQRQGLPKSDGGKTKREGGGGVVVSDQ